MPAIAVATAASISASVNVFVAHDGSAGGSHGAMQRGSSFGGSEQQPLFGVSQKAPSPRITQSALVSHSWTSQEGMRPQRIGPSALRMQMQSRVPLQYWRAPQAEASVQDSGAAQLQSSQVSPAGHVPSPSHASPHSTTPSPQILSRRLQSPAHPSQDAVFPSSQLSPESKRPSPHSPGGGGSNVGACVRAEKFRRSFRARSLPLMVAQLGSMRAFSFTCP